VYKSTINSKHANCSPLLPPYMSVHTSTAFTKTSVPTHYPPPPSCRSSGQRVGYADQILGFDCGGQQWVLEVAFPIGSYSKVTSSWRAPNRWGHELTVLLQLQYFCCPTPAYWLYYDFTGTALAPLVSRSLCSLWGVKLQPWQGCNH